MAHHVRRRWNQLKVGDYVKLKNLGDRAWTITMKTGGAQFVAERDDEQVEVSFSDYEYSFTYSRDCLEFSPDLSIWSFHEVWSACEQHYGISHYGSHDLDPIRALALAILSGDPQACDAARDVLKS